MRTIEEVNEYDLDPNRVDELVTPDELNHLLREPRLIGRDQRKITHLITRFANTLAAYRQQIQMLHHDVQQANLAARQVGMTTTMSPLDAVQYLTPEQLAQVLDAHAHEKMRLLERLQTESEATMKESISRLNHLKFVVTAMIEDPETPDRVRQKLLDVLAKATPAEPATPVEPQVNLGDLFS